MGGATRYWLHHALQSLQASLRARYGGDLVVRDATGNGNVTGNVTGNGCGTSSSSSSFDELAAVVRECGAKDVYCNRVYEPWKIARDRECERKFSAELNVRFRSFNAGVLYEPWDARPDATDDACWNSGYGSVRFFLRGCARLASRRRRCRRRRRCEFGYRWISALDPSASTRCAWRECRDAGKEGERTAGRSSTGRRGFATRGRSARTAPRRAFASF